MPRRLAVLWVAPEAVWQLFVHQSQALKGSHLMVANLTDCVDGYGHKVDLTEETWVVDATYSWPRKCFGLLLESPKFQEVPDGAEPPPVYFPGVTISIEKLDVRPDAIILAVPG